MTITAAILMAGANIHGRMLVQEVLAADRMPILVINEVNTPRAKKLSRFLENPFDNPPTLEAMSVQVFEVPDYASPETMALLAEFRPRYLINGGCGIFRRPLLDAAIPLNVHPGLLPNFRGLDPVLWSLVQHAPIGATVHMMSEGIDEGPILVSRELAWRGAGSALELRLQCMRWGGKLLGEYLLTPEAYSAKEQDAGSGSYWGAFPQERMEEAEIALRSYRPTPSGNHFVNED